MVSIHIDWLVFLAIPSFHCAILWPYNIGVHCKAKGLVLLSLHVNRECIYRPLTIACSFDPKIITV